MNQLHYGPQTAGGVIWKLDGRGYHAAVAGPIGTVVQLSVDEAPDGRWDWAIVLQGQPETARHGVADAAHEAMQAAELAALRWP